MGEIVGVGGMGEGVKVGTVVGFWVGIGVAWVQAARITISMMSTGRILLHIGTFSFSCLYHYAHYKVTKKVMNIPIV